MCSQTRVSSEKHHSVSLPPRQGAAQHHKGAAKHHNFRGAHSWSVLSFFCLIFLFCQTFQHKGNKHHNRERHTQKHCAFNTVCSILCHRHHGGWEKGSENTSKELTLILHIHLPHFVSLFDDFHFVSLFDDKVLGVWCSSVYFITLCSFSTTNLSTITTWC